MLFLVLFFFLFAQGIPYFHYVHKFGIGVRNFRSLKVQRGDYPTNKCIGFIFECLQCYFKMWLCIQITFTHLILGVGSKSRWSQILLAQNELGEDKWVKH